MKEGLMDGECGTHERNKKCKQNFGGKTRKQEVI
jgi:hypothetical protein